MCARFVRRYVLTACALTAVAACGGGGGDQTAGGGIGGTGISFGAVTQKGSIFVNGVEFSIPQGAQIIKDDVPIQPSDLQVGMTVEVHGSIDSSTTGTANVVFLDEAVRGLVESVSTTDNTMTILGQQVLIDENTKFSADLLPGKLNSIQPGDLIEVHGLVKNYRTVGATFIQTFTLPQPPGPVTTFSVRGFVESHMPNGNSGTFTVGPLTVTYDVKTVIDGGLPLNWTNLYLDIKGDTCTGMPGAPCGALHATSIDFEGFPTTETIEKAEMEGYVRQVFPDPNRFMVAGQAVEITPATVFVDGVASDMAVIGVKVEVEGSLAGPTLTARRVIFKDDVVESNATVTGPSTFTLDGLTGVTVTINAETEFGGGAKSDLSNIGGMHVRVRGHAAVGSNIVATEVELLSASNKIFVKGIPESVSGSVFQILGVTIDTTNFAETDFTDVNDTQIGSMAFFDALSAGDHLVKAQGTLSGSMVTWEEVELED